MPTNDGAKRKPKQCAYCGTTGHKITNEHVIPDAIAKTLPNRRTFHTVKEVFFDSDARINDTCERCNNVKLGELDNRVATVLKPHLGMGKWLRDVDFNLTLQIDWQTLARWLLKVSFNSARAIKANDVPALVAQRKFMLGEREAPPKLLILGGLIRSHRLTPREKQILNNGQDWLDPAMNRTTQTVLPRLPDMFSISRAVLIQHIAFMIMKPVRGYNLGVNLRKLEQETGFRVIERQAKDVTLHPIKGDALEHFEASLLDKFDAYRKEYGSY